MKGKRHMKVHQYEGVTEFAISKDWDEIDIIAYDKADPESWRMKRTSYRLITITHDGILIGIGHTPVSRLRIDFVPDTLARWRGVLYISGIDEL